MFKVGDEVFIINASYIDDCYFNKPLVVTFLDDNPSHIWVKTKDGSGTYDEYIKGRCVWVNRLIPEEVYNSPLYKLMKEEENEN